eukprot:SM002491S08535  [mRNA]  locus=s2491:116:1263:- [translate_table: standard]
MATPASRARALALLRRLLRTARTWPGPADEQAYIREEARTLFRRDQHLTDARLINQALFDGESRLELGVHYKIPYPRLHNLPSGSIVKAKVSTPVMGPVDDDDVMDDVLQARARHGGRS